MKQHCSVLSLMIRSAIYPVLLILALMAAVETGAFLLVLHGGPVNNIFHLEFVFRTARIRWIFTAAVLAATFFLCRTGCTTSSKPVYTLRRLSVPERTVYLWQALANFLFYLLLWSVQLLVAMGLGLLYTKLADPRYVTNMTVFLSFFRSPFLHTLLPLNDWLLWIANGVLLATLSLCSARFPMVQRRGGKFSALFLMLAAFLMTLGHEIHDLPRCLFVIILGVILSLYDLYQVRYAGEEAQHEELST